MVYLCVRTSKAFGLSKGQSYREFNVNPCSFNSCVRNDDGKVVYIPRKTYFKVEG